MRIFCDLRKDTAASRAHGTKNVWRVGITSEFQRTGDSERLRGVLSELEFLDLEPEMGASGASVLFRASRYFPTIDIGTLNATVSAAYSSMG
ncbi:MAG TPA: hypothetical protein VHQ86_04635 [Candidatus Saccharimonadia bacterium]|jgi:hypothetical protein|nr:hypothetical protein [Candidatus Saccharimonadia bacterium]